MCLNLFPLKRLLTIVSAVLARVCGFNYLHVRNRVVGQTWFSVVKENSSEWSVLCSTVKLILLSAGFNLWRQNKIVCLLSPGGIALWMCVLSVWRFLFPVEWNQKCLKYKKEGLVESYATWLILYTVSVHSLQGLLIRTRPKNLGLAFKLHQFEKTMEQIAFLHICVKLSNLKLHNLI